MEKKIKMDRKPGTKTKLTRPTASSSCSVVQVDVVLFEKSKGCSGSIGLLLGLASAGSAEEARKQWGTGGSSGASE